jgi:hypothetical protein
MPRIIVTVDAVGGRGGNARVLLDELVQGVHLENEQTSVQFLERLARAIEDGERLESVASPAAATERSALARR